MAHQFTAVDYVVFAITVITSIAIGLFFSRRRRETTTDDYLMAGRSMRSIPIALSLVASFLSAVSILGLPTEVYYYGAQYWMIVFSTIIVVPLVVIVYLPIFYQLKLTSVYEYLQRRFSVTVRLIASVIFIAQTILYSAVVIYAPAIALDAGLSYLILKMRLIDRKFCTSVFLNFGIISHKFIYQVI
jgi:Na+/proline symporter